MPAWTELKTKFEADPELGVPSVLSMPAAQVRSIDRRSGTYVMVSATGISDADAIRLRLQSASVGVAVLHPSDLHSLTGGADLREGSVLRIRSLRLRERLTLLTPMVWVLVIATLAAAAVTLASAAFPVNQSAEEARHIAGRIHGVDEALATLERQPLGLAALEESAHEIQLQLTSSSHRRLPAAMLLAADEHLAETLEHRLSESSGERMSTQQAAADLQAWSAALAAEATAYTSQLRSGLDSLGKVLAGIAGLIAAIVAFGSALPGSRRS